MTSIRELERRLDRADPEHEDGRIFVVRIGGDYERGGWYTYEEYEQAFGELPDSEFNYHINMHGDDDET